MGFEHGWQAAADQLVALCGASGAASAGARSHRIRIIVSAVLCIMRGA
jgi:hypothetical protein